MSKEYTDKEVEASWEMMESEEEGASKARKKLYITSVLILFIFITGGVPDEFLGVSLNLDGLEGRRVAALLSVIAAYFLISFVFTALQWRVRRREWVRAYSSCYGVEFDTQKFIDIRSLASLFRYIGENISWIIYAWIPIIVGVGASLLGWFPNWFEWLKFVLEVQ